LLETIGRSTGNPVTTAVGFADQPDGSIFIAAGSDTADWALNLQANPRCLVTIADTSAWFDATETDEGDRAQAVTALILKYGTPAERLGRGPVFRLVPHD
jgi:deazaflavin-dependent oxidoreductase (nitroreductase family)